MTYSAHSGERIIGHGLSAATKCYFDSKEIKTVDGQDAIRQATEAYNGLVDQIADAQHKYISKIRRWMT
jgi:hypothetical protein